MEHGGHVCRMDGELHLRVAELDETFKEGEGMKTPEEIKKGLECCSNETVESCAECPYKTNDDHSAICIVHLTKDAKVMLAQAERERDAAVRDLQKISFCEDCKHLGKSKKRNPCRECQENYKEKPNWQWRGVCEENTKEEE